MNQRRNRIRKLEQRLEGLANDARYWDLRRTYGDHSPEVLSHLEACAEFQGYAQTTREEVE